MIIRQQIEKNIRKIGTAEKKSSESRVSEDVRERERIGTKRNTNDFGESCFKKLNRNVEVRDNVIEWTSCNFSP